jgi:phage tail sheath protein FI
LDEYLERLSSQGAFQTEGGDRGYHVVCDESNNTAAVIDDQVLAVDVFVKPVRAAEYIKLQTIITTTGASFEELIARGVNF